MTGREMIGCNGSHSLSEPQTKAEDELEELKRQLGAQISTADTEPGSSTAYTVEEDLQDATAVEKPNDHTTNVPNDHTANVPNDHTANVPNDHTANIPNESVSETAVPPNDTNQDTRAVGGKRNNEATSGYLTTDDDNAPNEPIFEKVPPRYKNPVASFLREGARDSITSGKQEYVPQPEAAVKPLTACSFDSEKEFDEAAYFKQQGTTLTPCIEPFFGLGPGDEDIFFHYDPGGDGGDGYSDTATPLQTYENKLAKYCTPESIVREVVPQI